MEKKNIIPVWATVLLVLFCLVAVATNFLWAMTVEHSPVEVLSITLDMFVPLFAIIYCIYGYKKDAAVFMRIFSTLFMCSRLAFIPVVMSVADVPAIRVFLQILVAVAAVILAVGRNLKKKASFALVGVIVVIDLINAIHIFLDPVYSANLYAVLGRIGSAVTSVTYGIMVYAKYKDKEARGTE